MKETQPPSGDVSTSGIAAGPCILGELAPTERKIKNINKERGENLVASIVPAASLVLAKAPNCIDSATF